MIQYRRETTPKRGLIMVGGLTALAILGVATLKSGVFSGIDEPAPQVAPKPVPAAVANYVQFTVDKSAVHADASHRYSADGFRHLANALESLAQNSEVESAVSAIRAQADSLQLDQAAITHARHARAAADVASSTLGRMQQRLRPELGDEMESVSVVANDIDADVRLLEQTASVQAFFERSAQLIDKLSR